jgi:hypothetical protein
VTLWNKSAVRSQIAQALEQAVAPAGFRYRKKIDGFVRNIGGGRQELGIALWDHDPLFDFSLNLCVRLEAVQEVVNQFSGSPPRYHEITLTSITQLEFLGVPAEARGVVFSASSESELAKVIGEAIEMVRNRVVPFFDEYRDVASINRGLNPEGAESLTKPPWPHDRSAFDATNQPYRSMAGVAVAHIAGDPRLKELIAAYRAQVAGMAEADRQKLKQMVAFLLED